MAVTVPFQWELNGYLMGPLTVWSNDRTQRISGLGTPRPKTNDLPFVGRAGSHGGNDVEGDVVITIPLYTAGVGATELLRQEAAMNNVEALTAAWATSVVDVRLDGFLPAHLFYVMGRPRGVDFDYSNLTFGLVRALCTFETTIDPLIHVI